MNKSDQKSPGLSREDEFNIADFLNLIWAGKWLIGGVTVLAAVVSIVVTLMIPNTYRAEALLAPNGQDGAGGLSALAAQYGSFASFAGLDIGGGAVDKTSLGLEVLKSRKFISEFIERHDILVQLIAVEGWNSESDELIIDASAYDQTAMKWVRKVSAPRKTIPSSQEAYEAFAARMSVSQDKKSGFVTISFEHYSPYVAKQWVDWLIEDVNSTIMRQDVAEAQQAIDYLSEQVSNTSLTELQQMFFSLIEEQTKTVVLAKVTDEYFLKTLDPAIAPEKKSKPVRSLIVILATALGCFLGVAVHLVRSSGASQGHGTVD